MYLFSLIKIESQKERYLLAKKLSPEEVKLILKIVEPKLTKLTNLVTLLEKLAILEKKQMEEKLERVTNAMAKKGHSTTSD